MTYSILPTALVVCVNFVVVAPRYDSSALLFRRFSLLAFTRCNFSSRQRLHWYAAACIACVPALRVGRGESLQSPIGIFRFITLVIHWLKTCQSKGCEECLENVLCIPERKGFKIRLNSEHAEESDKAAVRKEIFVGSTFCTF